MGRPASMKGALVVWKKALVLFIYSIYNPSSLPWQAQGIIGSILKWEIQNSLRRKLAAGSDPQMLAKSTCTILYTLYTLFYIHKIL